jgi:hypothetical protein
MGIDPRACRLPWDRDAERLLAAADAVPLQIQRLAEVVAFAGREAGVKVP